MKLGTYGDRFPKGMIRFTESYLDSGRRERIQEKCSPGGEYHKKGIQMHIMYAQYLILDFLSLKFEDPNPYLSVRDLPREEQMMLLTCLTYLLGIHEFSFSQIAERFKLI